MENRFGFKDFVFSVLFVAFIIVVFMGMRQLDRQTETLLSMNDALRQQTRDMARLQDQLRTASLQPRRSALPASEGEPEFEVAEHNPFQRLLEIKERDDFAYGDTLMQVFASPPDSLTPILSQDAYASMIQDFVLESLLQRNPETLEWEPWLARDWEVEQNIDAWQAFIDEHTGDEISEEQIRQEPQFLELGEIGDEDAQEEYLQRRLDEGLRPEDVAQMEEAPSAIKITFHIRRGVRFSDGEPLTADDVVFTYDLIMDPEIEAVRARAYYATIKDVEKVDDYEVVFHFREPYFRALEFAGGLEILPEHFYGEYSPRQINTHGALLLGSGPYRMPSPEGRRPQAGTPIELLRNDRYWGEPPPLDRIVYRLIEQDSSREQAFRNREVDVFPASPEQYERLRDDPRTQEAAQRFNYLSPTSGYRYIGWNQRRGGQETPFADQRVRKAMTLLIDRERIVEEVFRGYARVATGPFNPLGEQANPQIQPLPRDVSRARELLREAGWEDRSGDGVLENEDGEPLAFEMNFGPGDTNQDAAMLIRDNLARAGIEMSARPLEWQVLLERIKNTREFDAVMLGWTGTLEGDPYQIFHSDHVDPPGDNATHYINPELDELIEQARMTVDESERMPMWHRVHEILHEDQPYTFLTVQESLIFVDGRLRNVYETATGLSPRTEWYVPAGEQRR